MKPKILFISLIIAGLLTSCNQISHFYQVYKTSNEGLQKKGNLITYEDENCAISYNLWGDGGSFAFRFHNKTDKNIYLNKEECFFVRNGNAYNYYQSRVYAYSSSTGANVSAGSSGTKVIGASTSISGSNYYSFLQTNSLVAAAAVSSSLSTTTMASKGYSVSFREEKWICIPPETSKVIAEYSINETPYRDCDMLRFPSKKQNVSKTFNKSNSPYVFSNRITYRIGQDENEKIVENEFYVTEISNLPKDKMLFKKTDEYCGQKNSEKSYFFKDVEPDRFFIKYEKSSLSFWKY